MIINPFLFFRMDVSGFRTYILKLELKFCFLSNIVVCNLDLLSPRRITAVSNWSHLFQIANLEKLTAEWEYKCYFKTILKWSHRQGNSKTKKEAVMLNLFASQIDTGSAGKKHMFEELTRKHESLGKACRSDQLEMENLIWAGIPQWTSVSIVFSLLHSPHFSRLSFLSAISNKAWFFTNRQQVQEHWTSSLPTYNSCLEIV